MGSSTHNRFLLLIQDAATQHKTVSQLSTEAVKLVLCDVQDQGKLDKARNPPLDSQHKVPGGSTPTP